MCKIPARQATLCRWRKIFGLILASCFCGKLTHAAEPLQFDRFFPMAVATGGTDIVTAEGKFPTWPVEVICDRSDVAITCAAESGKLNIDVAKDSAPGVAWVRLANPQGMSDLKPLLIVRAPVLAEQEPNGTLRDAAVVALPITMVGRLEKSEDVDGFRINLAAGESLYARVSAKQVLNSNMDAVLQITDLKGNVLMQSDDEVGIDPQLVFVAQQPQQVIARVFAFPETPNSTIGFSGAATYVYALHLTKTPVVDHFLPLLATQSNLATAFGWGLDSVESKLMPATNVSPVVATTSNGSSWQWLPSLEAFGANPCETILEKQEAVSRLPALFSGHISNRYEVDVFRFHAIAEKKMRAKVHSRQLGFPLDSVVTIVDPSDGREIARNDDGKRNDYDAALDFSVKADAELELRISDLADSFGPRHAYSIHVSEIAPSVSLAVASDHFNIKPGESMELPVTVTRQDGFDLKLSVQAQELPPGLSCESVVSEAKGDSSKSVQLKITADPTVVVGHFQFRIAAAELDVTEPKTWKARYQLRPEVTYEGLGLTIVTESK
jgi:hypothetical protein